MGTLSWIFTTFTFLFLEVGDSTSIELGANLLFTAIIGHVYLVENVSKFDVIILVVDVTGIVLISKPSFLFGQGEHGNKTGKVEGVLMALISALISSLRAILVKKISMRGNLYFMLLYFFLGVLGVPLTLLCSFFCESWSSSSSAETWAIILLYTVFCFIQTVAQATALNLEDTKTVAVSSTISTVLTYVVQLTVFGTAFDWVVIIGALFISVTVILAHFHIKL